MSSLEKFKNETYNCINCAIVILDNRTDITCLQGVNENFTRRCAKSNNITRRLMVSSVGQGRVQ
jgi:hypothetical protein